MFPQTAHYGTSNGYQLPDPSVTPGAVAITDKAKICGVNWGKDARLVTDTMKKEVCDAYGVTCLGYDKKKKKWPVCCEADHLISRELGGADDIRNLWPQPWKEAKIKDRLENTTHKLVCSGKMPLNQAQQKIAHDWVSLYKEVFGTLP